MTTQIAVKLDEAVLERVDALVTEGTFESRSATVRHALDHLLTDERRRHIDQAFVDGYRRLPTTDEELAEATQLGIDAINQEPWEPWW